MMRHDPPYVCYFGNTVLVVVKRLGERGYEVSELYRVGHLERLRLGTSYTGVVEHVKRVLSQLPRGTELVIDFTRVGRPVYDMFVDAGVDEIVGVLITGGNAQTSSDGRVYNVPKMTLVSGVQTLLDQRRTAFCCRSYQD